MRLFRLERETRDARRAHERELAEAQQLKKVLASRDPDAILSAAGLSTRELLDRELVRAMKEGAPADDPVQQTVDASEKRVTDRIAQLEAKAAQLAHQTAMESFVQTHLVPATSDPEKFEALQLFFPDARARGYQLAAARQEHFDACGEWMPIEDAAERLERYYDGKLVEGAATLSKTKRYGSRFAQSAPTAAVAKKPPPSPVGTARSAPKPKVAGASPSPERLSRRERLDAIVRKAR
jgi:hypothetical protein